MPWTNNTGGGPRNPWGSGTGGHGANGGGPGPGRGTGGGPTPPDIDALINMIAARLRRMFSGGPGNAKGIALILIVLAGIWAATGLYRVKPEEDAIIQRFGEWVRTQEEPGLNYHLPAPIETHIKPNVTIERRTRVGFNEISTGPGRQAQLQDLPEESLMLTSDANIVDIDFVVTWKIGNAADYIFNIRDPEGTLKKVAESAMREVVGQTDLQTVITTGRSEVQARAKKITQKVLDQYGSGILISEFLVQDAGVPGPVLDAFEDVVRAVQDAQTFQNEAQAYRNDIVPKARGEAIRMREEAEGYKQSVINRAQGDAERFGDVYAAYAKSENVTRQRMYLETMEEVLSNAQTLIMDGGPDGAGILPYLPLDEFRKKTGK